MATKLLCLLLVTACTAELGFRPKQQYKYAYEAKQASGIPEISSQWSALGLKMTVIIQVPTQDNLYVQLQDVNYGELHNEKTNQPWRQHLNIPYRPDNQFQQHLTQPFKVQMRQGMVHTITTSGQEPTWVVNIKKSIVQLFQLDMQRQQSIQEPTMPQPTSYLGGKRGELGTMFRVMEGGIGGQCETIYETSQQLTDNIKADIVHELNLMQQPSVNVPELRQFKPFYVTKTKNYQNCRTRPIWQHMTPPAVACHTDDCHLTASNSSATARYLLDGDNSDFQIQAVVAESEALVYPYGHETEQLWTVTNQTLFLQKSERMGHFMGEPQQPKQDYSLAFRYPTTDGQHLRFPDLRSEPQISTVMPGVPIKLIKQNFGGQKLIQRIVELIKKVDSMMEQVPKPETQDVTGLVVEIERASSLLSYREIQQVYYHMQTFTQKDIFFDVLSAVGTNPAVSFLVDLISRSQLSSKQMASVIKTLPMNIKTPTPELLKKLVQLFKSETIQSQKNPRAVMALSLANIFHQVCISNVTVDFSYSSTLYGQPFCNEEMQSLLQQTMIPFLQQQIESHKEPEKLVYIQALGNIGHKSIVKILERIFTSPHSPPMSATGAIYALRHINDRYPETVRNLVMPLFSDPTVKLEVRVAALTTILVSNPPIAYWQRIAVSTWFEPSQQMVSFIHSAFNSLANNTDAHVQPLFEMSRRARAMTRLIRPPGTGIFHTSGYDYNSEMFPKYQVACIRTDTFVTSPESVIPSVFYSEYQHYVNSLLYSTSTMATYVQGVETVVRSLLQRNSNPRLSPRDIGSASETLRRITQVLNIKDISTNPDFQASLYVQLMGAIDNFFSLNAREIQEFVGSVPSSGSVQSRYTQKILYFEDKTVTFPSEMGLPVVYVKKFPLIASVRGKMNVTWDFNKNSYGVAYTNVQPFVAAKSRVMVSTVSPWSLRMLGVGVEHNYQVGFPVTLAAQLDSTKSTLQVNGTLLSHPSPVTVFNIRTHPFTTAILVNAYTQVTNNPDTREVRTNSRPVPMAVTFGRSLGLRGYINMVSDSGVFNFGTMYNTFIKSGSPESQLSLWYLLTSLHSRHYQIVLDTASSPTQSVVASFVYTDKHTSSQPIRQSITQSTQHLQQLTETIRSVQSSLQQSRLTDYLFGVSSVVTLKQRSGSEIHYKSDFSFAADAELYEQKFQYNAKFPYYKVCLNTDMKFPRLSESRQSLLNDNIRVPVNAYLGFGTTCQQHSMEMTGYVERDNEQRHYAQQCPQAQRCQLHEQRGNPNSADCRIAKDHAAMANVLYMDFTWNNLPQPFRNASYQLDYFSKYIFWPFMSNSPFKTNAKDKTTVQVWYHPFGNYASAEIRKPFETTQFNSVPMAYNLLEQPYVTTLRKPVSQKIADAFYGVDKSTCISDRAVLKTFDNVTISRRPSSECWTLLTKDASGFMNLAILDKLISGKPAVRVLADQSDVQVSFQGSSFQVLVDGQQKSISQQQSVKVLSPDSSTLMHIQQITSDYVLVQLPQQYAKLLLTTEGVQVYMSQMVYRNKLTGICSSMDGEVRDELVGPQGCIYRNAEDFLRSFVVPLSGSPQQCRPQPAPTPCVRKPSTPISNSRSPYNLW